jgi:hypothetical protein
MSMTLRHTVAVALAAIAAASYFLTDALGIESHISAANPSDVAPAPKTPLAGSGRMGASVADPGGDSARWAVRRYSTTGGENCVQDGQTVGGRFGRTMDDGFAERGLEDTGMCASATSDSWAAVTRYPDDPRTPGVEPDRTVILGVLADAVKGSVGIELNGRKQDVAVNANGVFIHVLKGLSDPRSVHIDVPGRNGTVSFDL